MRIQELAIGEYKQSQREHINKIDQEEGRMTVLLSKSSGEHPTDIMNKIDVVTTYESERSSVFNENL